MRNAPNTSGQMGSGRAAEWAEGCSDWECPVAQPGSNKLILMPSIVARARSVAQLGCDWQRQIGEWNGLGGAGFISRYAQAIRIFIYFFPFTAVFKTVAVFE